MGLYSDFSTVTIVFGARGIHFTSTCHLRCQTLLPGSLTLNDLVCPGSLLSLLFVIRWTPCKYLSDSPTDPTKLYSSRIQGAYTKYLVDVVLLMKVAPRGPRTGSDVRSTGQLAGFLGPSTPRYTNTNSIRAKHANYSGEVQGLVFGWT